jgi:hypothetical protein
MGRRSHSSSGTPLTRLTADRDLAMTTLAGNLIPATQGLTLPSRKCFVIPPATAATPPKTVSIGPHWPERHPGRSVTPVPLPVDKRPTGVVPGHRPDALSPTRSRAARSRRRHQPRMHSGRSSDGCSSPSRSTPRIPSIRFCIRWLLGPYGSTAKLRLRRRHWVHHPLRGWRVRGTPGPRHGLQSDTVASAVD